MSLISAAVLTIANPAAARNCYEGFSGDGCPWAAELKKSELEKQSCQNLAHIRNQLYNENGYCFSKPEYADLYDNSDCHFDDQDQVPLNNYERTNIFRIRSIEKAKGC